jgi:hypothetical protein
LPRNKPGFWLSQETSSTNSSVSSLVLTADGQPIYLACLPASACIEAPFGEDGCNGIDGYSGRRCASCSTGFHPVGGKCSSCEKNSSSILVILIVLFLILVGAVVFVLLMTKLNVDISFFTIAFNFFQSAHTEDVQLFSACAILMVPILLLKLSDASLVSVSVFPSVLPFSCSRTVGTFKNFQLHWPESSNSFFHSVSNFLNFNPDLLSFECWVPEDVGGVHLRLQYQHKVGQQPLDADC